MSAAERSTGFSARTIVGLLIVAFGLAQLADNLGWIQVGNLIRYWPFGLILVGLVKLLDGDSNKTGGVVMVAVGLIFAAENFYFLRFDVWRWWPLAIVIFGILVVVEGVSIRSIRSDGSNGSVRSIRSIGSVGSGGSVRVVRPVGAGRSCRRLSGSCALRIRASTNARCLGDDGSEDFGVCGVVGCAAAGHVAGVQARGPDGRDGRHRIRSAAGGNRSG